MAELGSSDIRAKADASNAISGPTIDVEVKIDLCNASNINQWSFFRPRPIQANATTKIIELATAPANDRKLGDFRRYNHTATEPHAANDYTQNWGPGGSVFEVTAATYIYEINVKEIAPSTTLYWTIDYYLSSSDRAAKTNRQRRYTTTVSLTSETPPTGHTNNQTQRPASNIQVITDSNVPTSMVSSPDDTIYLDTYISDVSSNEIIRFTDSYTDVSTHEYAHPRMDAFGSFFTPVPSGYTGIFPVVTSASNSYLGVDVGHTWGSSNYSFYWYICGVKAGSPDTYWRLGNVAATCDLKIYRPELGTLKNTTQIFNATLNSAGASSNQVASGTLSSGYSWGYDDVGDIFPAVSSWTGFNEYALPGAP